MAGPVSRRHPLHTDHRSIAAPQGVDITPITYLSIGKALNDWGGTLRSRCLTLHRADSNLDLRILFEHRSGCPFPVLTEHLAKFPDALIVRGVRHRERLKWFSEIFPPTITRC